MISKNLNNGILPNHDESLGNLQMWIISWTQVVPSYWGTKGVTAALLLSLQLSLPPLQLSLQNKTALEAFLFLFLFQQTASSRHARGRRLFGKMKRVSWDPRSLFLLCLCSARSSKPSMWWGRMAPRRSVGYHATCTRIWDAPKENILSMDLKWSVT